MSISHLLPARSVQRARVRDIKEVAPAHYQLCLEAPHIAKVALPGQFIHALPRPNSSEDNWNFDPLLRRAFSIMEVNELSITILFRVEGRGTKALAAAHIGDEIELIGPLGRPFDISPFEISNVENTLFHVKQNSPQAIVVGGGVGVPPLVYMSRWLRQRGVEVHAVIGARSEKEIIGYDELNEVCAQVKVTTDDGSRGHAGRVTDLLPELIGAATQQQLEGKTVTPVLYSCGPWPMLRGVAQICAANQVRCQVSLEENMPCGVGVCNGCVVRVRQSFNDGQSATNGDGDNLMSSDNSSSYGNYRRVCVEGPACWADEIDWQSPV